MKIKFVNKTPNEICMFLNELLDAYDLDLHIANVYLTFEQDEIDYDLYEVDYDGNMRRADITVNRRSLDLDYNNACGLRKLTNNSFNKAEKEVESKREKKKNTFVPLLLSIENGHVKEINREEWEMIKKEEMKKWAEDSDDDF